MLKKIKSAASWAMSQKDKIPKAKSLRTLTMCRKCYTFYYKNSWHFERPDYIESDGDLEVPVRFTECPACLEQELAFYDLESEAFA